MGIPAVLSSGIPGNALRAFPGSFRNFSGDSSGKSRPYWGYGQHPPKPPFWKPLFCDPPNPEGKRHVDINRLGRRPARAGQSPGRIARGQRFMYYPWNQEHESFGPGARLGRPVTIKAEISLGGFWSKRSLENRGFFSGFFGGFLCLFSPKEKNPRKNPPKKPPRKPNTKIHE